MPHYSTGIFTDGSAQPNPGAGGWSAVYVVNDEVITEEWGREPYTTNNRMELMGLRAACLLAPSHVPLTIYSDSDLCVKTFTIWAHTWKMRGWTRGNGNKEPIKNLELVQEVYELLAQRPWLSLVWIRAHVGNRWNEYADALARSGTIKEHKVF